MLNKGCFNNMLKIKPDYYDKFKCLKGKCPSSCCEKWQVVIDKDTLDYYNSLQSDFGKRLRGEIVFSDGDSCFKIHSDRCAFLNCENLCDIHCNLGQNHMAKTCVKYPDFTVGNHTVTVCGQSISCPYVAEKIICNRDKVVFLKEGNKENDKYENHFCDIWFSLINIAQSSSSSIEEKIQSLFEEGLTLQKSFSDEFCIEGVFFPEDSKGLSHWCDTLSCLEYLTDEWKNLVEKLCVFAAQGEENIIKEKERFAEYINDREYEYSNILVYFLYRYFMEYLGEGDVILPLRFAVYSTRVIYSMGVMIYSEKSKFTTDDQIKLCYLFGKEIEHSQSNLDSIFDDLSLGMI